MNKEEWKMQYATARLLIKARFYTGKAGTWNTKEPHRKAVWDITYSTIINMHPSIRYAVFYDCEKPFYNHKIGKNSKWRIKANTKEFGRKNPIKANKKKWRGVFNVK